jgi:hypothetical protein
MFIGIVEKILESQNEIEEPTSAPGGLPKYLLGNEAGGLSLDFAAQSIGLKLTGAVAIAIR